MSKSAGRGRAEEAPTGLGGGGVGDTLGLGLRGQVLVGHDSGEMGMQIGDVLDGKYKILRLLGEGGMGAVFEGENTRIHRRVAIKVLHGAVAANDEAMTRFEREAQAAGRIGSEHIVEVLDMGDLPDGERYMVMEFLEGEALNDRIERERMAPRDISMLMVDMLEGLKAAHSAGIVHRDLKPENVFLLSNRGGKKDFVKIVDFGISKFSTMGGEFSMTRTGAVMGTPYYMAPEQAKGGKAVDHRVDLYAVGVILYQAVVGQVPFQAETFNELLFKIVLETPPPLEEQVIGIDPNFVNLVNRAMARDPDDRFQTAEEFQAAIKEWLGGASMPAGRTVSVGTPVGFDRTALPGPGVQTPFPQTTATTPGNWEKSQAPDAVVPVKKGPPLGLIAAGFVAVFAVVGAVLMLAGQNDDADTASQAEDELTAQEDEKKAEEERQAAALEEKAKAEEERKKAEDVRAAEARSRADKEADLMKPAPAPATKPNPVVASPRPTASPKASAPRPAPAPAPASQPAPAPQPAPKPGGRVIRTDL